MVELEGQSVVIRPFHVDELEEVFTGRSKLSKDALPRGPSDRERLRVMVERSGEFKEGGINLGIEVEGRLVGEIQTYRPPKRRLPPNVYEIGISLYDSDDRGKGWGTEAVEMFVDWLFHEGAERVQAGTAESNAAMRRVLEKLGFTISETLEVEGVRELLYGVNRSRWTERTATV